MKEIVGAKEQDVILTVREVAEYLKVADSTIYRLARQGKLPGRKIGGTWRFSLRIIDEWIYNYQSSAPSNAPESPSPPTPTDSADELLAD